MTAQDQKEKLNTLVAITVALLATFMGICKIKDDNICQAMQQAQADKVDHWNFYQARNIREDLAKATVAQLKLQQAAAPAARRTDFDNEITVFEKVAAEQHHKKDEIKKLAEQDQKTYDELNYRDDQFDLSDALLAIAVAMLAVTALVNKRWLFFLALVPTSFGVLMGVAGLAGLKIHPGALVALLS